MIIAVTILSIFWAIGTLACMIALVKHLYEDSGNTASVIGFCVLFPLSAVIAALPFALILESRSPNLAVLKKNEWACTSTRTETFLMPVVSGNNTTMVPSVRSVCIRYSRTN